MVEPVLLTTIILASSSFVAIFGKFLYKLRTNLKKISCCFGSSIDFRTPVETPNNKTTEENISQVNIDIYPSNDNLNSIVRNIRAIQV